MPLPGIMYDENEAKRLLFLFFFRHDEADLMSAERYRKGEKRNGMVQNAYGLGPPDPEVDG